MTKAYLCLLHPNVPKALLGLLSHYLHGPEGDSRLFFCTTVRHGPTFVEFGVVKRIQDKPFLVWIPTQYILAISERGEEFPVGFHPEGSGGQRTV